MKVEIYRGGDRNYYYIIKSGNGKILAESQTGFRLERSCFRAAKNLIRDIKDKIIQITRRGSMFYEKID